MLTVEKDFSFLKRFVVHNSILSKLNSAYRPKMSNMLAALCKVVDEVFSFFKRFYEENLVLSELTSASRDVKHVCSPLQS